MKIRDCKPYQLNLYTYLVIKEFNGVFYMVEGGSRAVCEDYMNHHWFEKNLKIVKTNECEV